MAAYSVIFPMKPVKNKFQKISKIGIPFLERPSISKQYHASILLKKYPNFAVLDMHRRAESTDYDTQCFTKKNRTFSYVPWHTSNKDFRRVGGIGIMT